MKEHKGVTALLRAAEAEQRCAAGRSHAERQALARRAKAGELVSPYCNLYADVSYWKGLTVEQQSLHTIRSLAQRHPQWVFAGLSAICVYGLQHAYSLHDGTVHIASISGAGKRDEPRLDRIYMKQIPSQRCRGIAVTTPERTLADCSSLSFPQALAIYDSALRLGLTTMAKLHEALPQYLRDMKEASRLLEHADGRSENGGESLMRGTLIDNDFALPLMQMEFENPDNRSMPYRVDFCWKLADGRILVAEYDGVAKYRDGSNQNRASIQSKLAYAHLREQHLRAQGVTSIAHVFFEDVVSPGRLEAKLMGLGVPKIR